MLIDNVWSQIFRHSEGYIAALNSNIDMLTEILQHKPDLRKNV
jgi:hypothetical protein